MRNICRRADVVISLNYINPLRPWTCGIPKRVLIDGDPVFSQIRNLTKPKDYEYSNGHNHFFTFAENYGKKEVTVPKDGFPWRPTRQPICLSAWPATPGREDAKFTSIMNWDSFPQYEYNGVTYGMKSHSFQEYIELPKSTGSLFELALGGANAPRDLLREKGWFILSPDKLLDVTRDPWTYQTYIQQSKGEFCINKQAFVVTQSGWFSEKSAAYLASGRPVLSLDTGYPSVLPTGAGLFAFSSVNDVQAGLAAINADYKYHCRKAREIAEEYFDAKKVLSKLLSDAGCG